MKTNLHSQGKRLPYNLRVMWRWKQLNIRPFSPSNWKRLLVRWTSLVVQTVKGLSTMRETRVQSLGWEDPLEKKMATHSSTIAWKIPWTEEPGRLQSMVSQRVGHDWATSRSRSWLDSTPSGIKRAAGCHSHWLSNAGQVFPSFSH